MLVADHDQIATPICRSRPITAARTQAARDDQGGTLPHTWIVSNPHHAPASSGSRSTFDRRHPMRPIAFEIVVAAALTGFFSYWVPASGQAEKRGRADLRHQDPRGIPQLAVDLRQPPGGRQLETGAR